MDKPQSSEINVEFITINRKVRIQKSKIVILSFVSFLALMVIYFFIIVPNNQNPDELIQKLIKGGASLSSTSLLLPLTKMGNAVYKLLKLINLRKDLKLLLEAPGSSKVKSELIKLNDEINTI